MSDLRKNLIRLAHANPELRGALLPLLKEAVTLKNFDGGTYDLTPPRSMYDKMTSPPFGWSTPARGRPGGPYPNPWRVAHADRAEAWLKDLTKRKVPEAHRDLYVDSWSDWRGHKTLWVGLRNNRIKEDHRMRLRELFNEMKKWSKVVMQDGWILLVDDIKKDALR